MILVHSFQLTAYTPLFLRALKLPRVYCIHDPIISMNSEEAEEYVNIGTINGLFVLGRSIGFIGETCLETNKSCSVYFSAHVLLLFQLQNYSYVYFILLYIGVNKTKITLNALLRQCVYIR